jgi:hypothetical protein
MSNYISVLFLVTILPFGHSTTKNARLSEFDKSYGDLNLDYIKFGVYCGECYGHCSTMYQYNMMGNANTLLVDTSESYFKNQGNIVCNILIVDRVKMQLANDVAKQVPKRLLNTFKSSEQFGCPDCTDGCGIYFEFKRQNETRKFYIDTDTTKLPDAIKSFSQLLLTTSSKLGQNK